MDGRTNERTEQGNNFIPELSLETAGIIINYTKVLKVIISLTSLDFE